MRWQNWRFRVGFAVRDGLVLYDIGYEDGGRVRVGRGAWVGIGASVIQCVSIGEYAVVGAGAAVIRDVPDRATVVGVPGKVIKVAEAVGEVEIQ